MTFITLPKAKAEAAAHVRLLERHKRHAEELRSDILQIVQRHTPRQDDMKARQERVDQLTEALTKLLAGEDIADDSEL